MKLSTAATLAILGVASVTGAVLIHPQPLAAPAGSGQLVFPGLAKTLPQATRIRITGGASTGDIKTTTLELKDGHWGIAERGGYPAQPQKMRELFAGLSDLKLLEPRTSNPASFARLGVDDPNTPNSTANLIRVENTGGQSMATLILGHRSQRSAGGLSETVYVRRPDQTQSWLAEGQIPADSDPQAWLVREIANIPHASLAEIVVQRGADHMDFTRKGDAFIIAAPPPGKLDDYKVEQIGSALEGLTLSDVRPGKLPGTPLGTTVFTTTDGLVLTVTVNKDDKTVWASFAATGKGAEVYKPLAGWAYQLPEWRQSALMPAASEMVSAEPPKPAAAQPPAHR